MSTPDDIENGSDNGSRNDGATTGAFGQTSHDPRHGGDSTAGVTNRATDTAGEPGTSGDSDDAVDAEVVEIAETTEPDQDDRPTDHQVTDDVPQLGDLLRKVARKLRRDFFSAIADEDFDPRDVADLRRRAERDDVTPGEPWTDDDELSDDARAEEVRERVRALRDRVNARVEEVLNDSEIAAVMAALTKIVDELAPDEGDIEEMRRRMRSFARRRGFDPPRGFGPSRGFGPGRGFGGPGDREHRSRRDGEDGDPRDDGAPRQGRGPHGARGGGHGRNRRSGWSEEESGGFRRDHGDRHGWSDGDRGGFRGGRRHARRGPDPREDFGPRGDFDPRDVFDGACDPREFIGQWLRGAKERGRGDAYERGFADGFERGFQAGAQRDES